MTREQADRIFTEHGQALREIAATRKGELESMYRDELDARGMRLLAGGPRTKDELIRAILDFRYPRAQLDEVTHLIYHQDSDGWSACEHCHPHGGGRCDCKLGQATNGDRR